MTKVGEHEYTLLRGHVDSVYGSVFIEYKNPSDTSSQLGPRLSSPGTRKVVEQITGRFRDVTTLTGGRGATILGIGFDGRYFVFCRFANGSVTPEEPLGLSRWSARQFLWAIFNLGTRGYALTPETLAADFGSDSELGRNGVRAFASACRANSTEPRTSTFFRQWRILFGEVCGYDVDSPSRRMKVLASHYEEAAGSPAELLFALHTYYALLMKLLAAHVAGFYQLIGTSPLEGIARAPSRNALERMLKELEEGGVFPHLGVTNFLEGDLFSWYLEGLSDDVEETVRAMASRLLDYNPGSLRDNTSLARDLLKKLYHELFPRQVRHDLGEYYTPDWLAQLTLNQVGYDGNPQTRLLDPACGSGTFLVLALDGVRKWLERNFETAPTPQDVATLVCKNIIGFDLNPIAVLAARTNYLIQLHDLFNYRGEIEIPIYLCDSVLTPSEYGDPAQRQLAAKPVQVPTSAELFLVPREVTTERKHLVAYCNLLGKYARKDSGYTAEDFVLRCTDDGIPVSTETENQHKRLFDDIRRLDHDRKNGVWARFIKNAFAPVFLKEEPVDLVVGNPPWVNWENLPGLMEEEGGTNYRKKIAEVFQRYGLFSLSGSAGRLGGGKKDLSMVFVYACVDHYLRHSGKLGFVITQTVFKSKGAGDGFRHLQYEPSRGSSGSTVYLDVTGVDDLSSFQPFEGATNRTAVFVCSKSTERTTYPVPYRVWSKGSGHRIGFDWPLSQVEEVTSQIALGAEPIDSENINSQWLTAPSGVLSPIRKIIGPSDYVAHAGTCTWLNGVYWVRIVKRMPKRCLIENLHDVGKIKVNKVQMPVEADLIYALLRGRDTRRWLANPSAWIILPQDTDARTGIPEAEFRRKFNKAYDYFILYEDALRQRSGFRKYFRLTDPFYSVYNVGPYTMAPWKVVWREQSARIQTAVVGPQQDGAVVVPDHKLMLVACGGAKEAYYLAALLNSSPAELVISAYVLSTSTSTHVLENVAIPKFNMTDETHQLLAELSESAHRAAIAGRKPELLELEARIDEAAARIFGLSEEELQKIKKTVGRIEADLPLVEDNGCDEEEE